MKLSTVMLFLQLLLLQTVLSAQVQWFQSQDSHTPPPNGTVGVSVQSLTPNSFVACYQWSIISDQFTWKVSKSHINGTEQRSFFITGNTAQVDIKVGHHNSLYVFERNFPFGQNAEYTIYKLDTNLVVKAQKSIGFPNGFNIFNMNAFELDNLDNIYFAGDGQYPIGPGFNPASFVLKMDKNFITQWSRMDSTQTSFTRLHVDRWGNVIVLADFYTFFPDVRITRITPNGAHAQTTTIHTNSGRFSLLSALDDDDNLLLYGGKFIGDTAQAMFLYKVSRVNGNIIFSKTLFTSPGSQLNDLKIDNQGNIFALAWQYFSASNQVTKVSRINPYNGNIYWNHSFSFAHDSCNLSKLVINDDDQFYVVGQRTSRGIFSKAFAVRMKKNGQADNNYFAPDSVAFQRSHWLTDGINDRTNQLIAIGSTDDLDPSNNSSTYFRSFAVKYGVNRNSGCDNNKMAVSEPETEVIDADETAITTPDDNEARIVSNATERPLGLPGKIIVYPNPVQNQLNLANLDPSVYDKLAVYSMQGILVMQQTVDGSSARINTSSLPNAVYMLVLQSSVTKQQTNMRFVVNR